MNQMQLIQRKEDLIGKTNLDFLFFYGHSPSRDGKLSKSCLSQWWQCRFVIDGISYTSAEQYMMAEKARKFQDQVMLERILATRDCAAIKRYGRWVRNFNPAVWNEVKYQIVVEGNRNKFGQNSDLKEFLLSTGEAILVEASPYDHGWGIKMEVENPCHRKPELWRGQNLLGFALMKVREELRTLK